MKTERIKGSPRYFSITTPSPKRQAQRLGPKFDRLRETLDANSGAVSVSQDPQHIVPERTLVFELAQARANFRRRAEKLGFAWAGEEECTFEEDDDFYTARQASADIIGDKPSKRMMEGRLYLSSPNQQSLRELLSLWRLYSKGKLPEAQKDWADFFSHLRDIRPWGPRDRLPDSTLSFLKKIQETDVSSVKLEVEGIFFGDPNKDAKAAIALNEELVACGSSIIDSVTIEEIGYHAVLIEVPSSEIQSLLNFDSTLLKINEIGYIRPQALCQSLLVKKPFDADDEYAPDDDPGVLGSPVAALLDGVPVENHELLKGRLIVSDPFKFAEKAPVNTRRHGTAMASLILHGDLSEMPSPLRRKLYVHCLLAGAAGSDAEVTSEGRLLLGVVYEAVKEICETSSASSNEVFIVNISLGDSNRPFAGPMSCWAKLLDFLSWKYRLLFVISAGNVNLPMSIPGLATPSAIAALTQKDKRAAFATALQRDAAMRTIFAPAEAINGLTVGARHSDGSVAPKTPYLIDPFDSSHFPAIISGVGLGYRRAIKPDILNSGGRTLCTYALASGALQLSAGQAGKYFGQQVAHVTGATARTRIVGTSNSAALVTRCGIQIFDALMQYAELSPELSPLVSRKNAPCVVKTLLVHSASWGEGGKFLESVLAPQDGKLWKSRRTNVTRFMGFGHIDASRVLACAPHRATLLGVGEVAPEDADIFEFPLPPSLSAEKEIRRLIVTMAWLSPVRVTDQAYRTAALDLVPERKNGYPIGVDRASSQQPPSDLSRKGTVIHEIFEGAHAIPISDGDTLRLRVECRKLGTGSSPKIPYAIAVTFEVAETSKIDVYREISSRIGIRSATRVRV